MTKKPARDRKDEVTYEQSLARLSQVVDALERGELPLEESLKLFEEGVSLSRNLQGTLDSAEKRVEVLLSVHEDGSAQTEPLDLESHA